MLAAGFVWNGGLAVFVCVHLSGILISGEFSTTLLDYCVFVQHEKRSLYCTTSAECQHVNYRIGQSRRAPLSSPCQRRAQAQCQHGGATTKQLSEMQDALSSHRLRQPQPHHWPVGQAQPALRNQDPSPSCSCATNLAKPVDLLDHDTGLTGFEIANLPAPRTVTPPALSVSLCSPRVLTSRKTSTIPSQPQSTHTNTHTLPACVFLLLLAASSRDNYPSCQLIAIFEDQC